MQAHTEHTMFTANCHTFDNHDAMEPPGYSAAQWRVCLLILTSTFRRSIAKCRYVLGFVLYKKPINEWLNGVGVKYEFCVVKCQILSLCIFHQCSCQCELLTRRNMYYTVHLFRTRFQNTFTMRSRTITHNHQTLLSLAKSTTTLLAALARAWNTVKAQVKRNCLPFPIHRCDPISV